MKPRCEQDLPARAFVSLNFESDRQMVDELKIGRRLLHRCIFVWKAPSICAWGARYCMWGLRGCGFESRHRRQFFLLQKLFPHFFQSLEWFSGAFVLLIYNLDSFLDFSPVLLIFLEKRLKTVKRLIPDIALSPSVISRLYYITTVISIVLQLK